MYHWRERQRSLKDSLIDWTYLELHRQLNEFHLVEWRSRIKSERERDKWVKYARTTRTIKFNDKKYGNGLD